MTFSNPESAREHLRNALAILQTYREFVERPLGSEVVIEARDLRAVEARVMRALEQIERGNL